jgi:hypothetical protein
MNTREQEFDDLTEIGEIGEIRQAFIRESLNVRTYQDLANLSVEEIASAFKAEGKPIARKIIQQWINEAAGKAEEAEKPSYRDTDSTKREIEAKVEYANEEGEWEWLNKIFVVEFRVFKVQGQIKKREISVYQIKASKNGNWLDNGKERSEVVGENLYPWMVQQLGEQEWRVPESEPTVEERPAKMPKEKEPTAKEKSIKKPAVELTPINVTISQIDAFQSTDKQKPIGVGKADQLFEGFVEGDKPFDLEVAFDINELNGNDVTVGKTSYIANFYVHGKEKSISLGDTNVSNLEPGRVSYRARLSELTLKPGAYRIGVVVNVRTTPPSVGYLEVRLLHVI